MKEKQKGMETHQLKDKEPEDDNVSCPRCSLVYSSSGDDMLWICCDNCERWFDFKCSGLRSRRRIPEKYTCGDCKCGSL